MTVLGGLQSDNLDGFDFYEIVSIPMTVLGGLQCLYEGSAVPGARCFNTDDGIRRAAMLKEKGVQVFTDVSIPMTVLGGLQFDMQAVARYYVETVSIPMTVLGGLQLPQWTD